MKNIVILISGRGSNMDALVRAAAEQAWREQLQASVVAVIANRPNVQGIELARQRGLATAVIDHRDFPSRESFEAALMQAIDQHDPALVVLAGFMRVLTAGFVEHYAGRLINVHPSLLPAFTGLDTHRRALEAGVKVHGATVHFVTPALDHGPIIAQAAIAVQASDTEQTLAERVLAQEHQLLPQAVRWFLEGALTVRHGVVHHTQAASQTVFG